MDSHSHPKGASRSGPGVASAGRIYDYFLNGRHHTPADEEAARKLQEKVPELHYMAQANRIFLQRAAGVIARAGVDQFIDLGSGIPTAWNTHEVVQVVHPDAKVVYVDNDPVVLDMSRDMLRRSGETNVAYVDADIADPASVLGDAEVRRLIDFDRPVGYMHVAIWHFVDPGQDPWKLLRQYLDAVPSGSYLALSHVTADGQRRDKIERFNEVYRNVTARLNFRTFKEIDRFFDGWEYLPPHEDAPPGLSYVDVWGSKNPAEVDPSHTWIPAGVARKP
ncbi:SAM-dependent methyltransferase [Actinomadura opuntiae]|uniref:SAM-dependent methyltransferase n=1 Tax=Actinomadura sp. OS1-43 TaxID=604315 RepID=UPI00255AEA47|nr:SAM-dependent methyltransferase [Actinomadura sp. OS1-43]MDL4815202.1 SAM-dependent methyltransferase [Actinomadura sp. OS1-43]